MFICYVHLLIVNVQNWSMLNWETHRACVKSIMVTTNDAQLCEFESQIPRLNSPSIKWIWSAGLGRRFLFLFYSLFVSCIVCEQIECPPKSECEKTTDEAREREKEKEREERVNSAQVWALDLTIEWCKYITHTLAFAFCIRSLSYDSCAVYVHKETKCLAKRKFIG